MKPAFAFGASLTAAVLLFVLVPACSSTKSETPVTPPVCDNAKCAPGNTCLAGDGETKCRKTCSTNLDPATSCPAGYTCATSNTPSTIPAACTRTTDDAKSDSICGPVAGTGNKLRAFTCPSDTPPTACVSAGGENWCCNEAPAADFAQPFCVKQYRDLKPGPKQWGTPCNAAGGIDGNPDCDSDQDFRCYGTTPGDGAAYCTRYDCNSDRECAAGFFCARINETPNIKTVTPWFREDPPKARPKTIKVCLRRDFCAPCKADLDCPPLNGLPQHCVGDDNNVGFCSPECTSNDNCTKDAKCVDAGIGTKTCYPRAGLCIGDGGLCAPCRSDDDCGEDGVCVQGQYTTERSCAKKSAIKCKDGATAGTDFKCPASSAPKATVRCLGGVFVQAPPDYCHGIYPFGESADVGCWTPEKP